MSHLATFLLLAVTASAGLIPRLDTECTQSFSPLPGWPQSPTYSIHRDTSYYKLDEPGNVSAAELKQICQSICSKDASCKAYIAESCEALDLGDRTGICYFYATIPQPREYNDIEAREFTAEAKVADCSLTNNAVEKRATTTKAASTKSTTTKTTTTKSSTTKLTTTTTTKSTTTKTTMSKTTTKKSSTTATTMTTGVEPVIYYVTIDHPTTYYMCPPTQTASLSATSTLTTPSTTIEIEVPTVSTSLATSISTSTSITVDISTSSTTIVTIPLLSSSSTTIDLPVSSTIITTPTISISTIATPISSVTTPTTLITTPSIATPTTLITSLTTSITTTTSILKTPTPSPSPRPQNCPEIQPLYLSPTNNTTPSTPKPYEVACATAIDGDPSTVISMNRILDNLVQCIDLCSNTPTCIAVSYYEYPQSLCALFWDVQLWIGNYRGVDSARLIAS